MTSTSILLMIVAILLVWGGLVASIIALNVLPTPEVEVDSNGNVIDDPALEAGAW